MTTSRSSAAPAGSRSSLRLSISSHFPHSRRRLATRRTRRNNLRALLRRRHNLRRRRTIPRAHHHRRTRHRRHHGRRIRRHRRKARLTCLDLRARRHSRLLRDNRLRGRRRSRRRLLRLAALAKVQKLAEPRLYIVGYGVAHGVVLDTGGAAVKGAPEGGSLLAQLVRLAELLADIKGLVAHAEADGGGDCPLGLFALAV